MNFFENDRRRTLVLKRGREGGVANRHPWIFAGAIARESGPDDAAIADLVDERGALLASGLHSLHSQIRLRALMFGNLSVTADTITARVAAAIRRRAPLFDGTTSAARLVHAEGDELSGLVVDRYDDVLVVEIANYGLEQLRPLIVETLQRELAPRAIFFKNDLPARKLEHLSLSSEVATLRGSEAPDAATYAATDLATAQPRNPATSVRTEILESSLRFVVDPAEGQKTGFFLDQRENRRIARTLAAGKRVLNLFSYSGAFGVYASAGGAASVTNVDVSAPAIALARTNHELNGAAAEFVVADAFDWVRKTREQFDLVICDPPAFAKSRGEVDRAARGYKDINLHALRLVAPGGMLMTFSCSGHLSLDLFQKVIFSAALDSGRRASFIRRLTAGPDHPVSLFCPESEYLKGFLIG
jgi:23S rRNA (cytosine1962-C5)-methyltransferase